MDLLLEHDLLVFNELLDDKIIPVRSAKKFEEDYLKKCFHDKITIIRVLDSRKENFKLSKLYVDKVSVINVITAPEIEMLIIHAENKYSDWQKSKRKPSDYCKQNLSFKDVKKYDFVKKYFSDITILLNAIKLYKQNSRIIKGEHTLYDLLKKPL